MRISTKGEKMKGSMKSKPRRKRCNTCIHFKYGVNPKNKRGGYYCEETMKYARSYLQLKECKAPQYKHK